MKSAREVAFNIVPREFVEEHIPPGKRGTMNSIRDDIAEAIQAAREEGARWALDLAAGNVDTACTNNGESNWPAGVVAQINPADVRKVAP